ncbi:MAG TPA: PIN domain-containing protein [bacterium]|nr:PIN domain-containing protein [bacterium]
MILTDAGPLVAIVDRGERDHGRCRKALRSLTGPMLTTWPAFTEAMYLLGGSAGWTGQEPLWRLVRREDLQIAEADQKMITRMSDLMARYRDLPMDLADASLVTLAEARGITRIFTLDEHFRIYRAAKGKVFTLIP